MAVPPPPVQPQQIVIGGNVFTAVQNPLVSGPTPRTCLGHIIEFLRSTNGAFRELQLFERVAKVCSMVLQEMGSTMSLFMDAVASKLGLAWGMLTIPRLPDVTKKAWEAFTVTPESGPIANSNRSIYQKVHDVADATAAWSYGISLLAGSTALKNAADVPNFVSDVTDLSMASEDWSLAKKHLEYVKANQPQSDALQQRFADTQQEAFWRIVKAVASVVSGVLGLLVLAFGGPVVPAAFLLAIGLTSTIAAMTAYFFKEMMPYEKVDFFKFRDRQARLV